jgi:hypothetical protein
MIWSIEYERINNKRVNATFITKTSWTDVAIGKFEKLHKFRVTVIECKPKYETALRKQLNAIERDMLPTAAAAAKPTGWSLNVVDDIAWKQDASGIYVYINWDMQTQSVRLDIMAEAEAEPLQSFIGKSDNVRKAVMQWLTSALYGKAYNPDLVSLEHAAYIGSELERCNTERIDYVQD